MNEIFSASYTPLHLVSIYFASTDSRFVRRSLFDGFFHIADDVHVASTNDRKRWFMNRHERVRKPSPVYLGRSSTSKVALRATKMSALLIPRSLASAQSYSSMVVDRILAARKFESTNRTSRTCSVSSVSIYYCL